MLRICALPAKWRGSTCSGFLSDPARKLRGVSILRIFLPHFSILGGQYLPDCHKKQLSKSAEKSNFLPEAGGQHGPDYPAEILLNQSILFVNNIEFEITEIEFYYFYKEIHEDNYTHPHKRKSGEWRFHNQGLDITLDGSDIQDGGILIRGIKYGDMFVNGPIKVVQKIFESFGSVSDCNKLMLVEMNSRNKKIFKTFRHLPNKITFSDYHDKPYRYLTDLDELSISENFKDLIRKNSTIL